MLLTLNRYRLIKFGLLIVYLQIPLVILGADSLNNMRWLVWGAWCLCGIGFFMWDSQKQDALKTENVRLHKLEARYAAIFNASPIPMCLLGQDFTQFVDINQAALNLNGYTKEKAINHPGLLRETWREADKSPEFLQQLQETGHIHNVDVSIMDKNGIVRRHLAFVERIQIEDEIHYATYSVDVTELNQMRERLEQTKHELDRIVQVFPDLFVRIDANGMIYDYMSGSVPIFGVPPEQFLGGNIAEFLPAENVHTLKELITTTIETKKFSSFEYAIEIDTFQRHFELRLSPEDDGVLCIGREITDRKQSELELQESEEKFRQLADNFNGVLLIRDLKSQHLIYISPSFYTFWGYAPNQAIEDSRTIIDSVYIDDHERVQDAFDKQKRGEPCEIKYRIYDVDRKLRWVHSRHILITDEQGTVYRVAVLIEDITERKKAEIELSKSERLFRQVAENLEAILYVTDLHENNLIYINPYFETVWQRDSKFMLDNPDGALPYVHPDDKAAFLNMLEEHRSANTTEIEYRIIRNDGETRWLRSRSFPIEPEDNTSHYRMVGLVEDITERKQAEESLREREQIFEQIAGSINEMLFVRDLAEDKLVYISPRSQDLYQHSPEEILADKSVLYDYVHPEDYYTAHRETNKRGTNVHTPVEYRLLRKDGTIRWVRSRVFPIYNEHGAMYRHAGIVEDITERMQRQKDLLETELLRAELEKQRELAQMKEHFISTVSHEFRTPLAVIQSSTEIIEHYHDRLEPPQREKHLTKIKSQIEQMVQMLDDVLALSFGKSPKRRFSPVQMDLIEFSEILLEEFAMTDDHNQPVHFQADDDLRTVVMDARLLKHIINNLVTNARKYSAENKAIHFTLTHENDHVVITVRDEGIGIPESEQDSLFEPFQRASNVGNKRGTGLGLAIVKNSVDVHGGTITFESEEGVGSTFTVRLPLHASELEY